MSGKLSDGGMIGQLLAPILAALVIAVAGSTAVFLRGGWVIHQLGGATKEDVNKAFIVSTTKGGLTKYTTTSALHYGISGRCDADYKPVAIFCGLTNFNHTPSLISSSASGNSDSLCVWYFPDQPPDADTLGLISLLCRRDLKE